MKMIIKNPNERCYLYTITYRRKHYVGITSNPAKRQSQHADDKHGRFGAARNMRIICVGTRRHMQALEIAYFEKYHPELNYEHPDAFDPWWLKQGMCVYRENYNCKTRMLD